MYPLSVSFFDYFVQQGFLGGLFRFVSLAVVYACVSVGLLALIRRQQWSPRGTVASLVASTVALGLFAAAVVLFHGAALYFRSVPHGSGSQRHGEGYDRFVSTAGLALLAVYVGALVAAALIGYALGRLVAAEGRVAAAIAVAALGSFMVMTFPLVEFGNACDVGRAFVLDSNC